MTTDVEAQEQPVPPGNSPGGAKRGNPLSRIVRASAFETYLLPVAWILVIVGIAILLWWFVWSLVRNIKGVLALNENKPIANPASWLFG